MKTLKITAILFAVMSFMSCKKETNISSERSGNIEQTTEHEKKFVASDWFQMKFLKNGHLDNFLEAIHKLDESVNLNDKAFELLLFARIPGTAGDSYQMVPGNDQKIESVMQYEYTKKQIKVKSFINSKTIMNSYSFRYFAVDAEYYQNAGIDWSDYKAVETLLSSHFTSQ